MVTWDTNLNALKDELAYLFSREDDYYVFVQEVGLDLTNIVFTRKARNDWHAILEEAQKVGMVLRIIEKARGQYPDRIDLRVAECYVNNKIQQTVSSSYAAMSLAYVDMRDSVAIVFECLAQVQLITQFLSCWQNIVIQVNKNMPGSPLLFEQCDSVKPSIQDLKAVITNVKQLLTDEHIILALDIDQRSLVNKLGVIDEELDDLIRHIQYLLDCNDKKTRYAMELRQNIQSKIAEVMQKLEGVNGLTISRPKNLKQENFLPYEDLSRLNQAQTPLKIVPTSASPQPEAAQALSSNNLSMPKKRDLRHAIFEFFTENELIIICSELAEEWGDNNIKYGNIQGNTRELKINYLVDDYCGAKEKLLVLKDWLIQKRKGFGDKFQEIVNQQK